MRPLPFMIVARTVAASSRPGTSSRDGPFCVPPRSGPWQTAHSRWYAAAPGGPRGLRILDQMEDGRVVLADDVDRAVGRFRRRVAEERSAVAARDVQRVVEMDRGEQSLVARRGEALLELLAFGVADDRMRIDVVDGERLLAEGRRVVGNGCVGQDCSPGMSLFGTGRSSIGQIGTPVTRSKT